MNKVGRVKKYTNNICRDNHIHYTSLRLLFSIIMHLLMATHWCHPQFKSSMRVHVGEIHYAHRGWEDNQL